MAVFSRKIPHTIRVDEQDIPLEFKRMTIEEFADFKAQFEAYKDRRDGAGGPSAVTDETVAAVTPDERAELARHFAWLRDVFSQFIEVRQGGLTVDGERVTDGLGLFELIGNYLSVVPDVLMHLYYAQCLTAEQKKSWQSLRAFETGSTTAPQTGTLGERPEPAVAPAVSEASVAAAVVTPLLSESSGTTVPSSFAPVQSGSST